MDVKKIFISQPMSGRTSEEILNERNFLITFVRDILETEDVSVAIISSYFENDYDSTHPLKLLGKDLELLSEADGVIFGPGWTTARGCTIEHTCAIQYGIPIVYAYNN